MTETPHEQKFARRTPARSFAAIVLVGIVASSAIGLEHHNPYPHLNPGNHVPSQR